MVDRVGMVDLVDVEVLLDSLATEVMVDNVDWGKVNMGLTHWWKNVKKSNDLKLVPKNSTDTAHCNF